EDDLERLLAMAAAAGVRRLSWNVLFLRSPTREKYLRWLGGEFPRLLEAYEQAYGGRVYLGGSYRRRVARLVERLRWKHGFGEWSRDQAAPLPAAPTQLDLFD